MSLFWVKKYVKSLSQYAQITPETALGIDMAKDVTLFGDADDIENYKEAVKIIHKKPEIKSKSEPTAVLAEEPTKYGSGYKSMYKKDDTGKVLFDDWGRAVHNESKQYIPNFKSYILTLEK